MRGKKVKELRAITKGFFGHLPKAEYEPQEFFEKTFKTLSGEEVKTPVTLPIRLGECQKMYEKALKKCYRNANSQNNWK